MYVFLKTTSRAMITSGLDMEKLTRSKLPTHTLLDTLNKRTHSILITNKTNPYSTPQTGNPIVIQSQMDLTRFDPT